MRHASFNGAFRRLQRSIQPSGRCFTAFHARTTLQKGVSDASATCFAIAKDHTFKSLLFFAKIRFFSQTKGLARQFLFTCHAPSTAFFHSPQCSTSKHSIKCAGKEFKTPSYPCLRESMSCGERLGQLIDSRFCLYKVGCSKSKKIKVGKKAPAPSQRRFALARIIVCCGASIVAHFACKVRATNT